MSSSTPPRPMTSSSRRSAPRSRSAPNRPRRATSRSTKQLRPPAKSQAVAEGRNKAGPFGGPLLTLTPSYGGGDRGFRAPVFFVALPRFVDVVEDRLDAPTAHARVVLDVAGALEVG